MDRQEIKDRDYTVQYDPDSATVNFQGELSLGGPSDYKPIAQLLSDVAAENPSTMNINLRELKFLNSSGISMLSEFVVGLRKNRKLKLAILGSKKISWQGKSLKNLQRLRPGLKLELELFTWIILGITWQ